MAANQITDSVLKGKDAELASVSITALYRSCSNGLTALVGGAQAGTALSPGFNRVTVVATAADSVQLPTAEAGLQVFVKNTAANAVAIFPKTGEVINALAANASLSLASVKSIMFFCTVAGTWDSLLTA